VNERATNPNGAVFILAAMLPLAAAGQVATGKYLYTPLDPARPGGIVGRIAATGGPLVAAFAIPPDEPEKVYRAEVAADGRAFAFRGLPANKYDLLLARSDRFHEGLTLTRGENTLTDADRAGIERIVTASEPFFDRKTLHRLEGETGRMTGTARGVWTFLRTRESVGYFDGKTYTDHRRSIKLVWLEDVGPGWQAARTREIFTVMVKPGTGEIPAFRHAALGRIRVTDGVKDVGTIELDAPPKAGAKEN
jgi:hypothetical protein